MIKNNTKFLTLFLLPALLVFSIPSTSFAAECPAFPKLSFWGDLSHDTVQNYVESKFDGDWSAYVERLIYIKKGLKDIQDRGKSALVKLKGREVVLKGEKLRNYLLLSQTRINVIQCLADQMEVADLQNFATAAGGDAILEQASLSDSDDYRTFLTLPTRLMTKLRKQAIRRSLVESQKVSVNDIISRTLQREFGRTGGLIAH